MRGFYTASYKIAGLVAAKTLMYITAPALKVLEIVSFTVTNESNATNFQFQIAIANITSLGTPTATSVTPTPTEPGDQASGSVVKANVTASEPTYGVTYIQEGAAGMIGYRYEPLQEERIYVTAAGNMGFRFITTPPAAFDCDVRLTFREIG